MKTTRDCVDKFYAENGPCCAGCDFWRFHNAGVGDCIKSAPVSSQERHRMLGIQSLSSEAEPGHIMTPREHWCGDFSDEKEIEGER